MKYLVHIVDECELPSGHERVIVERPDGPPVLLLAGQAARCWEWMRAWENTVEPAWQPTVSVPLRSVG